MLQGNAAGPVHSLLGVLACKGDHDLKKTVGSDVPLLNGCLRPAERPGANVLRLGQQVFLIGSLAGRLVGRAMLVQGFEGAGASLGVNANTLSLAVDPDQAVIPVDPHLLAQQPVGYRVVYGGGKG